MTSRQPAWLYESAPRYRTVRDESDRFATRVLPFLPEGHEILTRAAARGLPGVNLSALLDGVIRPDRGGTSYLSFPKAALHSADPGEQRRHSLRRTATTSLGAALSEIKNYLILLYSRAMSAAALRTPRGTKQAFEWVGEALHLIQDSYSQAHIERDLSAGVGGSHPIRYIRHFNFKVLPPSRTTGPREHHFPKDARDDITDASGKLKLEATLAIRASREYLVMMLRHMASPTRSANAAEFRAFLTKYFS